MKRSAVIHGRLKPKQLILPLIPKLDKLFKIKILFDHPPSLPFLQLMLV